MPSKNTTTVVLTDKAQIIKEDLAPVLGLKNILSAGLILLNELSKDDQFSTIQIANDIKPKAISTETLDKALAEIAKDKAAAQAAAHSVVRAAESKARKVGRKQKLGPPSPKAG